MSASAGPFRLRTFPGGFLARRGRRGQAREFNGSLRRLPYFARVGLKIWLDMSSLRSPSSLGLVAAFAAFLAGCSTGGVTENVERQAEFDLNLPKPRDYPIQGIDVSKY